MTITSQASQSSAASGSQASGSAAPSSVSINPVDAPGGISMLTPPLSQQSSVFFKIGNTVTFSWTYTSVQATPTAVNVEAYCSVNKYLHPTIYSGSMAFVLLPDSLFWVFGTVVDSCLDIIILLLRGFLTQIRIFIGIPEPTMPTQLNLSSRSPGSSNSN